ncbi:hypothetical protein Bca52824_051451 [Brassica carinata]|uniref:Uncharacterized protein n=1 Tax=Brassica carinata TaxID=52824 RepID=A0A8X7UJU5_BRACI|nr:hypothetical protein Bca52824_051451 [Brassica carinata]
MLDYDFTERLGYFGISRFEDYGDSLPETAATGTKQWVTLQPVLTTMETSTRTDVYSFDACKEVFRT